MDEKQISLITSERFAKNDLKRDGKKLAFWDTCTLGELRKYVENGQSNIINEIFINERLIPIVNMFSIYEFVKGLGSPKISDEKFKILYQTKCDLLKILEGLNAFSVLNHDHIHAMELTHVFSDDEKDVHDFCKIFSRVPLDRDNGIRCRPYLKGGELAYGFLPITIKKKDTLTIPRKLHEFFEMMVDEAISSGFEYLAQSVNEFVDIKNQIAKQKGSCLQNLKKMLQVYLKPPDVEVAYANLTKYWPNDFACYLKHAPLTSIYLNFMDDKTIFESNCIFDESHASIALSYCDVLITNDEKLQDKSKRIVKKLDLSVRVASFERGNVNYL